MHHLSEGLTAAGMDVTLFASGDSRTSGNLVAAVPEALRLAPGMRGVDPTPYRFKLLAEVAARADEFDIIHNHDDFWMLPLTRMTKTPLLSTVHGRMDLPGIEAAFDSYPEAHYVSISDSQRRPMPKLRWARTIHHGIDASRFEFRAQPGKYLAFLGRMSLDKRPDWAIEVARRAGVPLKMAAKVDGAADQEYFETRVKPLIDGRFIEYVGEISDSEKSGFLGNALATVFPIDWPEPFGLVMLESLACGTPVLARPCGSVPEVLRDGVTGYVDADITKLADRVRDLGQIDRGSCRRWVELGFSLARMTEEYIDVYRSIAHDAHGVAGISGVVGGDRRGRDLLHSVQLPADRDRQALLQG